MRISIPTLMCALIAAANEFENRPPFQTKVLLLGDAIKEEVLLGTVMGMVSSALRVMVTEMLGLPATEPQEPPLHHVVFVFSLIGLANQHSASQEGRFRILPLYWPLSHGKGLLKGIKIEALCGDVRKYSEHKRSRAQQSSGILEGRKRRADAVTGGSSSSRG